MVVLLVGIVFGTGKIAQMVAFAVGGFFELVEQVVLGTGKRILERDGLVHPVQDLPSNKVFRVFVDVLETQLKVLADLLIEPGRELHGPGWPQVGVETRCPPMSSARRGHQTYPFPDRTRRPETAEVPGPERPSFR